MHGELRAENILVNTKCIGQHEIIDEGVSPYNIQILNYGQIPQVEISELVDKKQFSQLYCLAPE